MALTWLWIVRIGMCIPRRRAPHFGAVRPALGGSICSQQNRMIRGCVQTERLGSLSRIRDTEGGGEGIGEREREERGEGGGRGGRREEGKG